MNRKVDFVIAGAQKSGSTSLFSYVSQHPDIFLPPVKEISFFLQAEAWQNGSAYLRPFYRSMKDEKLVGMAHAHIFAFPDSAKRIRSHNPNARVIVVLRNPVDRAYSAYWHARREGRETCETFETALERESERRKDHYTPDAGFSYVAHGHYADHLEAFLEVFDRQNIKTILTEDLSGRGRETIADVFEWLGVDPDLVRVDVEKRRNVAAMPRHMWLHRMIKSPDSRLKRFYYAVVPSAVRFRIRYGPVAWITRKNLAPFEYPALRPETRQRLVEHFTAYNQRLAQLIDRDLSHWT